MAYPTAVNPRSVANAKSWRYDGVSNSDGYLNALQPFAPFTTPANVTWLPSTGSTGNFFYARSGANPTITQYPFKGVYTTRNNTLSYLATDFDQSQSAASVTVYLVAAFPGGTGSYNATPANNTMTNGSVTTSNAGGMFSCTKASANYDTGIGIGFGPGMSLLGYSVAAGVIDATAAPGVYPQIDYEILRLDVSANTMKVSAYRNGAFVTASASISNTVKGTTLGLFLLGTNWSGVTGSRLPFTIAELIVLPTTTADATALSHCEWLRQTWKGGSATVLDKPTTQIDFFGTSETAGQNAIAGLTYSAVLARMLRGKAVCHNRGTIGSLVPMCDGDATFAVALTSVVNDAGYSIGKKIAICEFGANELLVGDAAISASAFIAYYDTWTAYLKATGYAAVIGIVPWTLGSAIGGVPTNKENNRALYRAAMLADTNFSMVFDTDTYCDHLVAQAANDQACITAATGLSFQTLPAGASGKMAMDGTLVLNTQAMGSDGIHIAPVGHASLALALATHPTIGAAIGAVSASSPTGRIFRTSLNG